MIGRRTVIGTASLAVLSGVLPVRAFGGALRWPVPPQPARIPTAVGNFGHRRVDDYAWLKSKDWHEVLRDPKTLDAPIMAEIAAELAYSDIMLAPTKGVQSELRNRAKLIGGALTATHELADGDFVYWSRIAAGDGDRQVFLRRPAGGGPEQVLLDTAGRAKDQAFYTIGYTGMLHSSDGKLIGWAEDLTGSGIFRICVQEIATGRMLVEDLVNAHGGFAFAPGGRYLFWVGRAPAGFPDSVWRRDMVSGEDIRIHAEDESGLFIDLQTLASGEFVAIRLFNGALSETWLISAADPTSAPVLVEPRTSDLRYTVDHWNNRLVILTDADGAADMKVMTAPVASPGRESWRELVPHRPGRFIAALHPFRERLVREEWRDANPHLVAMHPDGREVDVPFSDAAYAVAVPAGQSWNAPSLAFTFQTPRNPPEPRRLIFDTGTVAQPTARTNPNFDPGQYTVTRVQGTAPDGASVPITLLRRAGATRDGQAPLLLYGYGSYGASVEPNFNAAAIALVDRGWTYAIAHVRGGAEKGSAWWRSVLKTGKKATFTDFIACAEVLVAQGYTAKGRIVAHGFSAGGLLVGAVFWMRPDLWAGVIAQAPFVDPLNVMDDFETHPLGRSALPIWGDPRVPAEYDYIASYSPYDNLKRAAYPALLATGALTDERVAYTDPLKFVVKARAMTTGHNPIMARIAGVGGHVGGTGSALDRDALFGAFAIWAANRLWGDVPQR